jgi:hypothetical protein
VRERRQAGEGFRSTGRDGQYGLGVIRVLLADDEMMVRAGVKAILAAASDIEVVAEAGDGHEALELARVEPAGGTKSRAGRAVAYEAGLVDEQADKEA